MLRRVWKLLRNTFAWHSVRYKEQVFESVDEIFLSVTTKMKASEQKFPVTLFATQ